MRRLLRRLFNGMGKALGKALCLLSLLACAGTCAAWARSYWVCDTWRWEGPGGHTTWYTSRGQLASVRWVLTASTEPVGSEFISHERRAPAPL